MCSHVIIYCYRWFFEMSVGFCRSAKSEALEGSENITKSSGGGGGGDLRHGS